MSDTGMELRGVSGITGQTSTQMPQRSQSWIIFFFFRLYNSVSEAAFMFLFLICSCRLFGVSNNLRDRTYFPNMRSFVNRFDFSFSILLIKQIIYVLTSLYPSHT